MFNRSGRNHIAKIRRDVGSISARLWIWFSIVDPQRTDSVPLPGAFSVSACYKDDTYCHHNSIPSSVERYDVSRAAAKFWQLIQSHLHPASSWNSFDGYFAAWKPKVEQSNRINVDQQLHLRLSSVRKKEHFFKERFICRHVLQVTETSWGGNATLSQ